MDKYLPELFSIMWQLGQEGSLGESGHMYMYGWVLHCSPETITTLLIGHLHF